MPHFKVITDNAGSCDDYADRSTYRFNAAGLLVIDRPEGGLRIYSPSGWLHLDEDPTPRIRPSAL